MGSEMGVDETETMEECLPPVHILIPVLEDRNIPRAGMKTAQKDTVVWLHPI